MKWSPDAVDRLERAIIEGARVQLWRRGTEYMVVPREIRSRGSEDELVGHLLLTGADFEVLEPRELKASMRRLIRRLERAAASHDKVRELRGGSAEGKHGVREAVQPPARGGEHRGGDPLRGRVECDIPRNRLEHLIAASGSSQQGRLQTIGIVKKAGSPFSAGTEFSF